MTKKLSVILLLLFVIMFLSGCIFIALSVYPYYHAHDVIFDKSLIGTWGSKDDKQLVVGRAGKNAYSVLDGVEDGKTNYLLGCLFEIKGQRFFDVQFTNQAECSLPLHMVWRVANTSSNLEIGMLNNDWLEALLKTNSKALRHMVDTDRTNDEANGILTADTEELQNFILRYATDTNAFPMTKFEKMPNQ